MTPTHPVAVVALGVPCPSCAARNGQPCIMRRMSRLGVHGARVSRGTASKESSDAFQHQRATAARARLSAARRHAGKPRAADVVSVLACDCRDCPSNYELAVWLRGLGLLARAVS